MQRQIASDVSGVAFSLNPQNNCFDEAVINANFGLGETVVAGVVTPDTYVVDKVELELIDKNIAHKSVGSVVPAAYRGFRNSDRAAKAYEEQFANDVVACKRLAARDMPIDELVERLLAEIQKQIGTLMEVMAPALVARWRIGRMFKNDDVDDLVVALEMDLRGNPTSEMGHAMYRLASFPEIQATRTGNRAKSWSIIHQQVLACNRSQVHHGRT